jgi:pyruvate carboxylase subunit B
VLFDDENDKYKMTTQQVKDLCYGLYGKTACPHQPRSAEESAQRVSKGRRAHHVRPAEILEPELEKAKEE